MYLFDSNPFTPDRELRQLLPEAVPAPRTRTEETAH
jgi:hypothetical protein